MIRLRYFKSAIFISVGLIINILTNYKLLFTTSYLSGRSLEEVQQHFKGESNLVKNTKKEQKGQINVAFERENP